MGFKLFVFPLRASLATIITSVIFPFVDAVSRNANIVVLKATIWAEEIYHTQRWPWLRGYIPPSTANTVLVVEHDCGRVERMVARAAEGLSMRNATNTPPFAAFDANGDGKVLPEEFNTVQA